MQFPEPTEYTPYYKQYIDQLPKRDPLLLLDQTRTYINTILAQVHPKQYDYTYAPGKWTIKQILSHVIDTEHILTYRALRFARGDEQSALPFDQDAYVEATATAELDWQQLLQGWQYIRRYTQTQFAQYSPTVASRGGSEVFPCTVRAVATIVSAHAFHHIRVWQERYLEQPPLSLDTFLAAS